MCVFVCLCACVCVRVLGCASAKLVKQRKAANSHPTDHNLSKRRFKPNYGEVQTSVRYSQIFTTSSGKVEKIIQIINKTASAGASTNECRIKARPRMICERTNRPEHVFQLTRCTFLRPALYSVCPAILFSIDHCDDCQRCFFHKYERGISNLAVKTLHSKGPVFTG